MLIEVECERDALESWAREKEDRLKFVRGRWWWCLKVEESQLASTIEQLASRKRQTRKHVNSSSHLKAANRRENNKEVTKLTHLIAAAADLC